MPAFFAMATHWAASKSIGLKKIHKPRIVFYSDVTLLHYPFAIARNTKRPPMDKQTKFCVAKPFSCIKILLRWNILLCIYQVIKKEKEK